MRDIFIEEPSACRCVLMLYVSRYVHFALSRIQPYVSLHVVGGFGLAFGELRNLYLFGQSEFSDALAWHDIVRAKKQR